MKKIIILFFVTFVVFLSNAQTRSLSILKSIAQNTLNKTTNVNNAKAGINSKGTEILLLEDKEHLAIMGYSSNGFVILAKDESLDPVWGYSDACFSSSIDCPAFQTMLDMYNSAFGKAVASNELLESFAVSKTDEVSFGPLITTQWGQRTPYNDMVPTNAEGERCAAGCVATCMAQVMNYYKYPTVGKGTKSYESSPCGGEITMDFSTINFDWDNMLDDYQDVQYTDQQASAAALLTYACGVASEMQYDVNESGAGTGDMAKGMLNHFGYFYDMIDQYNWTFDYLSNILQDSIPIMTFVGPPGHMIILDGYDSEGNIHINYGWNGGCNGYFKFPTIPNFTNINEMWIAIPGSNSIQIDGIKYYLRHNSKTAVVTVQDADWRSEHVSIPGNIHVNNTDYTVNRIGMDAWWCDMIEDNVSGGAEKKPVGKVELSPNVKEIGPNAFCWTEISSIDLSNVEFIGSNAFSYYTPEECRLDKIKYFGTDAFSYSNIHELFIGKDAHFSLDKSNPFFGSSCLETLTVDPENVYYDSRDNCNALVDKINDEIVLTTLNTHIPSSIKIIGNSAFKGSKMTDLVLPEGLVQIKRFAFADCYNLSSVTFPTSLKEIDGYAFQGCGKLTNINIPANVDSIGQCSFDNCESIAYISVNSDNKTYDSRNNCNAIIKTSTNSLIAGSTSTFIPSTVEVIGPYAFFGIRLAKITIPKAVSKICEYALSGLNRSQGARIYMESETPPELEFQFSNDNDTLFVPKGALNAYINADNWAKYKYIIEDDGTAIQYVYENSTIDNIRPRKRIIYGQIVISKGDDIYFIDGRKR